MAGKYFNKSRKYSFQDIMKQYFDIKSKYKNASMKQSNQSVEIYVKLQPTEESAQYTIKIVSKPWSPIVNLFVVEPEISLVAKRKEANIPHTYKDGSLCLYLPEKNEWTYYDSWAETLVPWASLWLYFFELWLATGKWLGGGVHPGGEKLKKQEDKQ